MYVHLSQHACEYAARNVAYSAEGVGVDVVGLSGVDTRQVLQVVVVKPLEGPAYYVDAAKGNDEGEPKESLVIAHSHTLIREVTVVVSLHHTDFAAAAVRTALGLGHATLLTLLRFTWSREVLGRKYPVGLGRPWGLAAR